MIQADLVLDEAGLLCSCRVTGHAGAGKLGSDIVCAAVSVLTRTFVRVLGEREGITLRGDARERGNFLVEVEYASEGREFLAAAGAFLMEGLLSVSTEFPDNCKLIIKRRN
ncbi:MAG: ribosomal-processing cysteine protease Prp [Treponema sp.]|nr:ribosomal-processing cysteine protease Prp [Treponema sp.]